MSATNLAPIGKFRKHPRTWGQVRLVSELASFFLQPRALPRGQGATTYNSAIRSTGGK